MQRNYVTRSATADEANRDAEDFYPTPAIATRQLLAVERFTGAIWEPACGDGAISRELLAAGYTVASTDLYDRGYGRSGVDFLDVLSKVDNVVTNPPFKLSEAFAVHALICARRKVVMLNRLSWLEGTGRYARLFNGNSPLARIWCFSQRLHFHRSGDVRNSGRGGMVAFAWYVWDQNHTGPVTFEWLPPFGKGQ